MYIIIVSGRPSMVRPSYRVTSTREGRALTGYDQLVVSARDSDNRAHFNPDWSHLIGSNTLQTNAPPNLDCVPGYCLKFDSQDTT